MAPSAEQYLAHIQAHGHTVRRGFTRDGKPVPGYSISLDPANPAMFIRNGFVWPQQAPPYNYVVPVHHCGITLGVFAAELGMRPGVDWFDSAWTPSGAEGFRRAGRWHDSPELGDWVFMHYGGRKIVHVGAVLDPSRWAETRTVRCFEFNVDMSGQGRVIDRPAWKIAGFGRPNYAPAVGPVAPIVATILAQQLTREEDEHMSIIAEIYRDGDLTGDGPRPGAVPIRHEVYTPGWGWDRAVGGNYTEANGFVRKRYEESEFRRLGLGAVERSLVMTDLVVERVKKTLGTP
jgi:hypothetical protein